MSTFDYGKSRGTAAGLLNKFGKSVSLTRMASSTTYDPTLGVFQNGEKAINGIAVLLNYNDSEIGNTVEASDRKLIYQGDDLEVGDKYGDFRVHAVRPLDPDESGHIIITAQLRK